MLTGELPIGRFAPPSKKVQIDVRLDEVVLRRWKRSPSGVTSRPARSRPASRRSPPRRVPLALPVLCPQTMQNTLTGLFQELAVSVAHRHLAPNSRAINGRIGGVGDGHRWSSVATANG